MGYDHDDPDRLTDPVPFHEKPDLGWLDDDEPEPIEVRMTRRRVDVVYYAGTDRFDASVEATWEVGGVEHSDWSAGSHDSYEEAWEWAVEWEPNIGGADE